eukprot:8555698-Prorocentrum_lima.AAC.1
MAEGRKLQPRSFYVKWGLRLLSNWTSHEVRRLSDDMELEICMRLKGGDPEGEGREPSSGPRIIMMK